MAHARLRGGANKGGKFSESGVGGGAAGRLVSGASSPALSELGEFGPGRPLVGRLFSRKVTDVAMEPTGVYGKPVWNVLTGHCELLLADPYRRHNIPVRPWRFRICGIGTGSRRCWRRRI
jgi:hypothetical protein